jgi:hypothetical protein
MRFLGWRLFIISIAVFLVDLFTLGNSNFITNSILQLVGQIVGIVAALSILINFFFVVIKATRKIRRHSLEEWEKKAPSEKRAIRIRRLVGFLIWIWLFVGFPLISMHQMGLFPKMLEAGQGSLAGTILFTIMVIIGTFLPSIFLSPLKIYLIPLFLLSFYFFFSKNQHKLLNIGLYFLVVILIALQIWKFSSITNPQTNSEQARLSIDGGNKLTVTIMDINRNNIDGVEACVSLLEDPSRHKCQKSGNDGKVIFMLKAGYYQFGFGSQSQDLPRTTTPEFDIKDSQTIETELIIGK